MESEEIPAKSSDPAVVSRTNQNSEQINLERRLDDMRSLFGISMAVLGVIFASITVFVGINLNSERESLRESIKVERDSLKEYKSEVEKDLQSYKTELSERVDRQLGEDLGNAVVQITDGAGIEISKQPVSVDLTESGSYLQIYPLIALRNVGNAPAESLTLKVYIKDPLRPGPGDSVMGSSDEPDFQYELFYRDKIGDLSPGMADSLSEPITVWRDSSASISGEHEVLLKLYSRKGELFSKRIRFRI